MNYRAAFLSEKFKQAGTYSPAVIMAIPGGLVSPGYRAPEALFILTVLFIRIPPEITTGGFKKGKQVFSSRQGPCFVLY
jgi:hypothetical protein